MYTGNEELQEIAKMLGKDFNSKYELIEKLGKGGFGDVYKVKDKTLNRECALKMSNIWKIEVDDENEKESIKQSFIREAQNLAQCQNSHIVQVYEVGGLDNIPYIVMQLVEGKNLLDLINEKGKLSYGEALEISGSVLPALQYIHARGLVHKDLKPENIILEVGSRKLVIIDFGLARNSIDIKKDLKTTDSTVIFERIKGSPLYMAPELWDKNNKEVNSKADIYSYGVILFQLLTGEVPFDGDYSQVKDGHLKGSVPYVKQKNPTAPSGMQKVIRKAMAKEPLERYADASALLDAIRIAGKEDDGYPPPEVQKQLADRYTFEGELIGQGQSSKLYSMRHLARKGEFALKIMDFDFTLQHIKKNIHDGEDVEKEFEKRKIRFIEKANFFYALQNHPNIVTIDNSGFVPIKHENIDYKIPYVVLKRIRGVKLEELIEKESPFTLGRILNIAVGILSALQEIHDNDYIYWEVIPRKIFIEEKNDNAILLSAGLPAKKDIAKEWVSQTKISDIRLVYVRENLPTNWKDRGIASDISLFGILFYQILMGEVYDKDDDRNLFKILNKETDDKIHRKMKNKLGLPDDILNKFLEIIRKTMAKNRKKRYKSMEIIIKYLEKIRKAYLQEKG